MRVRRLALMALSVVASALVGQDASAALQPPNEGSAEAVETQCSIDGQEKGFTGKALDAAVTSCVTQEAPELGVWEGCRSRGRNTGLKGYDLKSFVTDCVNAAP